MRKQEADYYEKKRELEDANLKLERDKEGFKNHVAHSVKSTEEGMKRLKEEEVKLVKLREDLRRESNKIKEERSAVQYERWCIDGI